ncbi:cysteine proteinase inhibitor 1-like [Capsicum chacoense]
MAFKSNSLSFATLSMIVIASTFCHVSAANDKRVSKILSSSLANGGWQSIQNTKDPKVMDIAKFAVTEENKRIKNVELKFASVSDGRFKVDNYKITFQLTIVAMEFTIKANEYEAVVTESLKNNARELISFVSI